MKWKNNRFKGPKDKDRTAWRTSWRLDWSERKEGWKEVRQEERGTGSCRAHRPWLWNTDCILCINRKLLWGFEEGKWHDPNYVSRSSLWLLCGKKDSRRHRVAAGRLVRESGSSRWQVTVAWIRVLAAEVVRNRSKTCFWRWSRCNSLTGLMWDHGEPVTRGNQCLLTEMGKSRQGVGTGLSGTGEHGSSVLLKTRHGWRRTWLPAKANKSEGRGEVRRGDGTLGAISRQRVFKATGLNESTKIMRIPRDIWALAQTKKILKSYS